MWPICRSFALRSSAAAEASPTVSLPATSRGCSRWADDEGCGRLGAHDMLREAADISGYGRSGSRLSSSRSPACRCWFWIVESSAVCRLPTRAALPATEAVDATRRDVLLVRILAVAPRPERVWWSTELLPGGLSRPLGLAAGASAMAAGRARGSLGAKSSNANRSAAPAQRSATQRSNAINGTRCSAGHLSQSHQCRRSGLTGASR